MTSQPFLERYFDGPINTREKIDVDFKGLLPRRVRGPADRNPHRIEAGLADRLEILLVQRDAPLAFARRLEHIPHVDAAAQPCIPLRGLVAHRVVRDRNRISSQQHKLARDAPERNSMDIHR